MIFEFRCRHSHYSECRFLYKIVLKLFSFKTIVTRKDTVTDNCLVLVSCKFKGLELTFILIRFIVCGCKFVRKTLQIFVWINKTGLSYVPRSRKTFGKEYDDNLMWQNAPDVCSSQQNKGRLFLFSLSVKNWTIQSSKLFSKFELY